MNQEWLIKDVLTRLDSVPDTPKDSREYLSFEEAQRIVDQTINYLGAHGDDTEYTYINGHRKRLAHSLSMIPKAQGSGKSCLDVGSYGYMCLWVKEHLGYDHVEGIEWHPDIDDDIIVRTLCLDGESIEIRSHNIDISKDVSWSVDKNYDTVLFFELLEHINHDPMGVMTRVHERLKTNGTLVMSVPNAISYKSFKEFLVGMPPWTYWFYEPDLSHEPRHCFEYTPIVFKALIRATGLEENAFRTIYAYSEVENEQETLEIARSFGVEDGAFGETMIIHATKVDEKINIRYPDVLYSPDGYYKNVYPHLHDRFTAAIEHFRCSNKPPEPEIVREIVQVPAPPCDHTHFEQQLAELLATCDFGLCKQEELKKQILALEEEQEATQSKLNQTQDWAETLRLKNLELEARVNELLFTCDCYFRNESDQKSVLKDAEYTKAASQVELKNTRAWAEDLSTENADLRGQINELLFACDCYLQQINDPARCVQIIREKRFRSALRATKSMARKTPVLRTALRPVYRSTKKFIKNRI